MPAPYKLTKKKENEFRRQKAAFKRLKEEDAKFVFLAACEWFPMEFWMQGQTGLRWYPTAVGMPFFDAETYPQGFATPEEAEAQGLLKRAEFAGTQPMAQPAL